MKIRIAKLFERIGRFITQVGTKIELFGTAIILRNMSAEDLAKYLEAEYRRLGFQIAVLTPEQYAAKYSPPPPKGPLN